MGRGPRAILDIEPATTSQTDAAEPAADQPAVTNEAVQLIPNQPSQRPAVTSQTPRAAVTLPEGERAQRAQPQSSAAGRLNPLRTWLATKQLSPAQALAAASVVLFAFVLRTFDLSTLPTGFHGDEGVTGLEAQRILREGSIGVYTGSALGQPTGPFYLDAVTVGLFGNTIWATRILSAIAGTLTVAATYSVVQKRFDHRTGVAAGMALATMTWSIHFSRIAFGVAWWPLVVLLAVAALDRAATDQSRRSWFIAGGLAAFGVYIYNSHWSFGPAVVGFVGLWLAVRLVTRKRVALDGLAFGLLGALVIGLPMLQFIVQNDGFLNHFNVVSLRQTPDWMDAGFGGKASQYTSAYIDSWKALTTTPVFDGADASGINRPVPLAFAAIALFGLVQAARRHRTTFIAACVTTLVLLPASTVLASGAVARRTYALSPLVAVFVGIGAVALMDAARASSTNKRASTAAAAAMLVVALATGVFPYFTGFRNSNGQQGVFSYDITTAVEAIQQAETDGPVYVNWFSAGQDFRYPTIEFLLDDTPGESRAQLGVGFVADLDLTLAEGIGDRDQIFVLIGPYVDELDRLRETNPAGSVITQRTVPQIVV